MVLFEDGRAAPVVEDLHVPSGSRARDRHREPVFYSYWTLPPIQVPAATLEAAVAYLICTLPSRLTPLPWSRT